MRSSPASGRGPISTSRAPPSPSGTRRWGPRAAPACAVRTILAYLTAPAGSVWPGARRSALAHHGVGRVAVPARAGARGRAARRARPRHHRPRLHRGPRRGDGRGGAPPAASRSCPASRSTATCEGAEIHILGYCMDYETPWFQDFCREQRAERRARVHRMVGPARRARHAHRSRRRSSRSCKEGSAGRPHVAQVMVARGYVKIVREAFDRYLRSGKPANVPRAELTPVDAVGVIRRAGGVPVLAHPGLADRDELIPGPGRRRAGRHRDVLSGALGGPDQRLPELCRQHGLVATGGSDFHGPHTGRAATLGSPAVPPEVWPQLQQKARELERSQRP